MVQTVKCPKCGIEFPLTEAVEKRVREDLRAEFEQVAQTREKELAERQGEVATREKRLELDRKTLDETVARKLAAERTKIETEVKAKVSEDSSLEMTDLKNQLAEKTKALTEAGQRELEFRKKQRQLETEKANLELEVNRRLDEERQKIRSDSLKVAEEQHRLKDAEKDRAISDLKVKLADMQRRIEQGSQQTQGEVLEEDLEVALNRAFPSDAVVPVPKGRKGADVIQCVTDRSGHTCGTIIWETKRTKSWSETWIPKLKDDMRDAKADVAVLVTTALPSDIETFAPRAGVWVTSCSCALALGTALRDKLIDLASAKVSAAGKQSKMELLYDYLSGPNFRQRVEAIVEAFESLKADLDSEKRAMAKIWAAREKQIERVVVNTAGMYGDLQGISGAALPRIEHLELKPLAGSGGTHK